MKVNISTKITKIELKKKRKNGRERFVFFSQGNKYNAEKEIYNTELLLLKYWSMTFLFKRF